MTTPRKPALRIFKPSNAAAALGLAVSHLMTKPAFAKLQFGDWSRILVGQINRGHYCFAVDADNQVVGFIGWALATREHAEGWVEGTRGLSFEDSKSGDCMIINAWAADDNAVTRFLLAEARRIGSDKSTVYFKRHYKDGTTRPARVAVNAHVATHIERNAERRTSAT
jgi:hemolysin-activating ACP:hemolysin acyltransferase